MALYKFVVLSAETNLKEQSIFVNCSLDIDEDSVSADNLFLLLDSTKAYIPIDIIVDGRTIQIKPKTGVLPNERYMLFIEKGILSITGNELDTSIIRKLEFKSEVVSEIKIISPFNFEELSGETRISWYETETKNLEKTYLVQIAEENAFYNNVFESFIDLSKEEVTEEVLSDHIFSATFKEIAKDGQYFVRIRAQRKDGQYGKWSEVVTFDKKEKSAAEEPTPSTAPEEPQEPSSGEGPKIIDYTKEKQPEKTTIVLEYEKYTEDTPDAFEIKFPMELDITDAVVKIKRRSS